MVYEFFKKGELRRMLKIALIGAILVFISFPILGEGQQEDAYPNKPVEIVVPWAQGGSSDTATRALVSVMGGYFPEPFVVVNKPGGGATVGTTEALNQPADGYTLISTAWGPFITQPHLKDVAYSPDDYEVIMQFQFTPRVVTTHPDTPYDTLEELMQYAKDNPGEVQFGVSAVGTTGHLSMAGIEMEHGVDFNFIPQGGGGPLMTALLGNHVDVAAPPIIEAGPLIAADKLKALGVTYSKRHDLLPDVPTCEELGYPVSSGVAHYIVVPTGVPEERVKILHDALKKGVEDPGFKELAAKLKFTVAYLDSNEAKEQLDSVREQYGVIVDKLGLVE